MNHLISNIKNVPGVIGVAFFKDDGTLAAYDFPDAYDKKLLNQVGLKFQPIKEILPENEGDIVYLCWEFEDLQGFYYPVEGGWVNIISSFDLPMPVLSLTMTAVANKLPGLLDGSANTEELRTKPDETVPLDKIHQLEKIFSLYLGPATPVLFKRIAQQLGFALDQIPPDKLKDILDTMMGKVPESKKADAKEQLKSHY